MYLTLKLLHLGFMAIWFAGLLGLPWVFGEHVRQQERAEQSRLRAIERTVYFGIMTPSAVLAVIFGSLLMLYGFEGAWLPAKLTLIVVAVAFHLYCGTVLITFMQRRNRRGRVYYRALSQVPLVLLAVIVFLAAAKPI
ncbi:membrane protein [Sulfurifustis variabilis]|uniref:Protoporphyrinogen IX oxidase n=1 Tax=Sulfurifustis variabilis TaxID=1675686 RepID=A0A1B4V228_9GAMM|nr:CopD family protein [Sulfurifustis variabilis]BAU47569.1 membrane protein [Sulfurifustis variabilis]